MIQLRKLAENFPKLSSETMENLKSAPILLGSTYEFFANPDDHDEEKRYSSELLRTDEVRSSTAMRKSK